MSFPDGFLWGSSASAPQCEGAYDADGKGLSIWDVRPVNPGNCGFRVTSDFYHHYAEDIALMGEMGLKAFRSSISWSRILPSGEGEVNQAGIDFYHRVFAECKKHGIKPVMTLVHYDIPLELKQKYGDWRNPAMCEAYLNYARVLFENFGPDEVPYWLTYNEYNATTFYGAIDMTGDRSLHGPQELYDIAHRMMVMQAQAMKLCHELCPGAKVGPVPNITTSYPLTSAPEDYIAALNMDDLRNNMYLDPFVFGTYPKSVIRWLDHQGVKMNVLPGDMEALAEAHPDFIAFNCYGNDTVRALGWDDSIDLEDLAGQDNRQLSYLLALAQKPGIGETSLNEHFVPNPSDGSLYDPWCLRVTARRLTARYHLPLMVTECGTARHEVLEDGTVHDQYRIEFLHDVFRQLEIGIEEGADIIGLCTWSAMDLVSTREGISKRYGFIYVDRDEDDEKASKSEMKRYRKDSFWWYKHVIETNGAEL